MPAKLTEEFFLYEQAWSDAGIIIRTDQVVPEARLGDFSLAVCKSGDWPPKRHIYRLEGEAREQELWETIRHFRRKGVIGWDDKPWDLEEEIRRDPFEDPSRLSRTHEFEGIRFWVVYSAQGC